MEGTEPTVDLSIQNISDSEFPVKRRKDSKKRLFTAVVFATVVGFVIGILIGRFAISPKEQTAASKDDKQTSVDHVQAGVYHSLTREENEEIGQLIIDGISSENIRENLRMLSKKPHLAGSERNLELAKYLTRFWEDHGIDQVALTPYDVLLSFPNMSNLNFVELLGVDGKQEYKSDLTEPILTPEENQTGVVPPFSAYSAAGDVMGDLVYLNYGRVEDYVTLKNLTTIDVTGKIVLARYGHIYRGDKVRLAEQHGAAGIILFSDPADYTGGDTNQVYPNDWWLPPSGAQRGVIRFGDGDPETPGYPSIETAFREQVNETEFYIPNIPCHPVGYGTAAELMRQLAGNVVPERWRGGMNVTYSFGGSFREQGWKARLMVSTKSQRATIYNAFGIIRGSVEPDRYVVIGNHRDAWVFGAIDPSSGTAAMMELSRVMGELVKSGRWRPRRTIIICSWGAEEFGVIGSSEWVEQYIKPLGARTVAYINVDLVLDGNFSMLAGATPLLFKSIHDSAKKVPNPNSSEIATGLRTVYDKWFHVFPSDSNKPFIYLLGSISDYTIFRDRLGVPIADLAYTFDRNNYPMSGYPLYHSVYETFYAVDQIMDKGFKCHQALARVWAEMTRHLSDSLILPFNTSDYAVVMTNMASALLNQYGMVMEQRGGINTHMLTDVVTNFTRESTLFERAVRNVNKSNPYSVRLINDQLMQLDRAFLDPVGLPGRNLKKHILLAESSVDLYTGNSFPGLTDLLFDIEEDEDQEKRWKVVEKHYSVILFAIQSATAVLRDVTNFMFSE